MGNVLSPPPIHSRMAQDRKDPTSAFELSPVWKKWLIDLAAIINKSSGLRTSVSPTRVIATTAPLSGGGDLSVDRTLSFTPAGVSGAVQINNAGSLGAVTPISVTITTAKLTALGSDGSMVFTNGILTSHVQAT